MHIGMQVRYCALGVSVTIRGSDGTVRNSHSWARAIERKLKMTSYPLRSLTLVIIRSNQKILAVHHPIPLDIHSSFYEHGPRIIPSFDVLGPFLLLQHLLDSKYPLRYVHLVIKLLLYNGEKLGT